MLHNSDDTKAHLIANLDRVREYTLDILNGALPEIVVHPDSGWNVKDLVAHITAWEEEVVTGLKWLQQGKTYLIPDLTTFDAYNARAYEQRRDLSYEDTFQAFGNARAQLKALILALPPEQVDVQVQAPWRGMGTVADMVDVLVHHERHHVDEIEQALHANS